MKQDKTKEKEFWKSIVRGLEDIKCGRIKPWKSEKDEKLESERQLDVFFGGALMFCGVVLVSMGMLLSFLLF